MRQYVFIGLLAVVFILGIATRDLINAGEADAYVYTSLPAVDQNVAYAEQNDTATSTSFSINVGSSSNQMLIVTMGAGGYGQDTSATACGQTMTKVTLPGPGNEEYYDYWYLLSPPQGNCNVKINYPSSTARQYGAVVIDNVNQTSPFGTGVHVGGNGGNPSATVTPGEANDLILYWLDYDDRVTNLVYTPNDDTLYWAKNDASGNTLGNKGALHLQSSSSTVSVGGTASGNGPWDLMAIPIRPAN